MAKTTTAPDRFGDLRAMLDALRAKRDKILAESAPLKERRDALRAEMAPLEAEYRKVCDEIKAIERPHLANLCSQISALARAMGARSMRGAKGG